MEPNKTESKKSYGWKALIPVLIFLGLYLGCGIAFTIAGADSPFGKMPRYVAVVIAILIALVCYRRDLKFSEKVDLYCHGAGSSGVMLLGIIVLMAGGFANSTAAIGGKDAMVNMGVSLIPTQFLIPGIFLICCIISTCIGTSMGTQVTMIPIAIALAQGAGLNPGMAGAAAIAGAYFGDNLSMISDTTIIACKGVDAEMKDKFLMNTKIAIPAAVLSMILYAVMSMQTVQPEAVSAAADYNPLTALPYLAVLVLAVAGLDVILVLAIGAALSCVLGLILGTASFFDWAMAVGAGMEDMFWLSVFSMLVSGMMALVREYGGIDWLVNTASQHMKSKKSCQYVISLLVMAISGTTLNNPVACLISSPIAKELGQKYEISSTKLATLMSIFSCVILMVVPHDSGCLLVQQYAGCSYLDIVRYAFYPLLLTLFTCAAIQFNLFEKKSK
ncbi:MAG TPA: sodium:proton antiporter [Oribacterium sp.]|nr:sodium:proton antiporter [Oribacterium sp.]